MKDWSEQLGAALASGDAVYMKAMLAQVPLDFLRLVVPQLQLLASQFEQERRFEDALICLDQLVRAEPGHTAAHAARTKACMALGQHADALVAAARVVELAPESPDGHALRGAVHEQAGEPELALTAYRRAAELAPGNEELAERIRSIQSDLQAHEKDESAPDPDGAAPAEPVEPGPPQIHFDPRLLDDASFPPSFDPTRVKGVLAHLGRYSDQYSPRAALNRLEKPQWLAAWDSALSRCSGERILMHGSELGVFALRALSHGAAHVHCLEPTPLDARITLGMLQKHFLGPWHELHGAAIKDWSEAQRRASFDDYTSAIEVALCDNDKPSAAAVDVDVFMFPRIDHTLLGTGLVGAVRRYLEAAGVAGRVVPASAEIHAVGIAWNYPGSAFDLELMERLRWSPYPQPLDLDATFWTALTATVRVGSVDFARFEETDWQLEMPVLGDGRIDAWLFWFDLDLGGTVISNGPDQFPGGLQPAVQYTDPIAVRVGESLPLTVHVGETRLNFRTQPPTSLPRSHRLPSWYVPMLGDVRRNEAYASAIGTALAAKPAANILDIGAGCGLLSMMAVAAGATRVVGCESHRAVCDVGRGIIERNGMDDRITLLHRDVRQMQGADMGPAADLALFELFDCSLIGEGVLHLLAHAREHLLRPDARYLPAGARLRAMVVECRLDRVLDVDANLLNPYRFSPGSINIDAARLDHRPLSEPFDLFEFDFATSGPAAEQREIDVKLTGDGTVGAVLFWFDLRLDDTTWLSNAPGHLDALHWKQGLQWLPELRAEAGAAVPLLAAHDGSGLNFKWRSGAETQGVFSTLPRFDPRWAAVSNQLEQQTEVLLQHCAQSPQEYEAVAAIAQRVAVDPAAHGIDPLIAQRFVAMFSGS
ncbi:MAG: 50S ribosomal protein L11 methyltransferase [Pseudomonadota bacterium]|nr:50S ribosomal protein L11 methyltransferase [Pseudomonadota bacterium]